MKLETVNRRTLASVKAAAKISETNAEMIVDFLNDLSHDYPETVPYLRTAETLFETIIEINAQLKTI